MSMETSPNSPSTSLKFLSAYVLCSLSLGSRGLLTIHLTHETEIIICLKPEGTMTTMSGRSASGILSIHPSRRCSRKGAGERHRSPHLPKITPPKGRARPTSLTSWSWPEYWLLALRAAAGDLWCVIVMTPGAPALRCLWLQGDAELDVPCGSKVRLRLRELGVV